MNYKKIFAALTAAGILAACTPTKKYKEFTQNDYNHKRNDFAFCTWNTDKSIESYYCIVTELDYNYDHNYYTVYADSDIEDWICIEDDITKETAMKMYIPGTKLAVLYLAGNRNNVIDIKVLEKP